MRSVNTVDLGVSLYLFGCELEEIDRYVRCKEDETGYIWFSFTDRDLELVFNRVQQYKRENVSVSVDDFYKVEHYISGLKKMCSEKKRELRGDF